MKLSNTYRRLLQIPADRIVILPSGQAIDAAAIKIGILFVLAEWAGASQSSFRSLNVVLMELLDTRGLRLYVADADNYETEQFIIRNGDVPSGGGETYWIKDGFVVAKLANYNEAQASQLRANTSLLTASSGPS